MFNPHPIVTFISRRPLSTTCDCACHRDCHSQTGQSHPKLHHNKHLERNSLKTSSTETFAGKTSHRQTTAAIQRCVQEGPKSLEHRPAQLGNNSPQTVSLETDCAERSLQLRRDAHSAARGKENSKKGCSPCRQASIRLRLCPLPQGLSFPYRTGQPHPTLYQNKHTERNSIVFRD